MYQNFVTDLIQYPVREFGSLRFIVKAVSVSGDGWSSITTLDEPEPEVCYAFEIDPTKDTLFSFKAALVSAESDSVFRGVIFSSPTPLSIGETDALGVSGLYLVPNSVDTLISGKVNFTYSDRVLLPAQISQRDDLYYYFGLLYSSKDSPSTVITLNARAHYSDKSVYQPSK